jgi:hypothetical protein
MAISDKKKNIKLGFPFCNSITPPGYSKTYLVSEVCYLILACS